MTWKALLHQDFYLEFEQIEVEAQHSLPPASDVLTRFL